MTSDPAAATSPSERAAEETWLDDAFDSALAAFERGAEFDVEAFARGHERLRPALDQVVRLARDVVAHPARDARTPRELAGYELERELGSGSMGTVYLARQRSLGGRRVALKVLPRGLGLSPRARGRFLSEARALGGLDHPGIVGVHDVLEAEGVVAYAMDWVPGGSLGRVIAAWRARPEGDDMETLAGCLGSERAALGSPNAIAWILQAFVDLLRALEAVHAGGLLHRDIKPSNVLVSPQGRLLLSDFGLVRGEDSAGWTRAGEFVGTHQYASPEQRRGEHSALDARSDVYSVGVTLFEALTLVRPFDAPALAESERLAASGLLQPLRRAGARLPTDVETILAKALEPEPAQRYPTAEAFARDLERFLAFRPILARPASRVQRLAKALRRNRRTLFAAIAGALVAIASSAAIGGYLWSVPRELAQAHLETQLRLASSGRYERFVSLDAATGSTEASTLDAIWKAELEDVRTACERALDRDPLRRFATSARIGLTRDLTALALAVGTRSAELPQWLAHLQSRFPVTAALARGRAESGAFDAQAAKALERASADDLYAAGLLGFLLEDSRLATESWERLPVDAPVDVLSQGALGQMYLTLERPELAYPYLWTAFRLAPRSNYLCCELADCAVRLGEVERATQLLDLADSLPAENDYEVAARIRADVLAKRGEFERARDLYQDLFGRHSGPRLQDNYAALLARLGERELEVTVRLTSANFRPGVVRNHAELLRAAESWWWHLSGPERFSAARRWLDGDVSALPAAIQMAPDLLDGLRRSRALFARLPATRPWDAAAPRRWRTPRFGPRADRASPELLELADELAWCAAGGVELRSLPPVAKDVLVVTLFAPVPASLRCIAALRAANSWSAPRSR